MADKKKQTKGKEEKIVILEREYIIPLRREWLKVPKYRRAERAITAIKQFLLRHMKIYDKDLKKIKIDHYVNEEIWFKGIKKPLAKIKVKVIKYMDNSVSVSLAEIPEYLKFKIAREEKLKKEGKKKTEEKAKEAAEQEKAVEEKSEEEKKEEKEEEKELEKDEQEKKEKEEILTHDIKEKISVDKQIKQPKEKKPDIRKFATGR